MRTSLAWPGATCSPLASVHRAVCVPTLGCYRLFSCTKLCRADQKGRGNAKRLLPDGPARTRFAPSPTGHLHLGSLRTALFNYLLAKKTGGQFILRIEDTDRKRTVPGAQERLCHDLEWAGLTWDEGPCVGGPHGPYNQSQRTELYQKHADDLIAKGVAYRCFCPAETASAVDVQEQSALASRIGGCQNECAHLDDAALKTRLDAQAPYVVRFAYRDSAAPAWSDLVYGPMKVRNVEGRSETSSIADTILLKSDGTPTYHLANVIDDHAMEITHVIRGTEWMSSTPLHVALYAGFGWQPPAFAHVGLLTDEAGNKLSKRNFDTDVKSLTEKHGLLPEALNNFLALMGWSNPEKSDVRDLDELVKLFDLKFTKGNSVVSLDKLWYLQRHHARRRLETSTREEGTMDKLDTLVQYLLKDERTLDLANKIGPILGVRTPEDYLRCILVTDAGNYESATSFLDRNDYFLRNYNDSRGSTNPMEAGSMQDSVEKVVQQFFDDPATISNMSPWAEQLTQPVHRVIAEANARLSSSLTKLCLIEAEKLVGGPSNSIKKSPEYRALSKQLHDHLRTKLTFTNNPGPASVMIMVVLGYTESKRRVLG